jgi:hypothetical protein
MGLLGPPPPPPFVPHYAPPPRLYCRDPLDADWLSALDALKPTIKATQHKGEHAYSLIYILHLQHIFDQCCSSSAVGGQVL